MNKATIGDLIIENKSCQYGLALPAMNYDANKIRYLRISDIDDSGNLLEEDKKSIDAPNIENYILQPNELVVARTGNSTGRTYVYSKEDGKLAYAGFLIKYKFDDVKINPRYIKYFTISNIYKAQINGFNGSTRGNMNAQDFKNIEVIYPDRNIQDKMVTLFDLISAKIKNNNQIVTKLESLAKTIYDYWFLQFEFPNEEGKPYKSSGGKMVWNEELKREIPKGWEIKCLGDVINTERGISYSTDSIKSGKGIPMINMANFTPGSGRYKSNGLKWFNGECPNGKKLSPYDLIMCNTQQTAVNFNTDIIGHAMLIPDIFGKDIVSSHHINVIRTENPYLKYYLLYLFNSDYFHKYITGFTNGTNILGLLFNGVEDYRTELPPADTLASFAQLVILYEKKKNEISKENQQLTSLRDFLLPLLMNGQVTFKDEAASEEE